MLTTSLGARFAPMRLRDYRLLWFGQTTSALGDAALPVAIAAAALDLHGSAAVIGWTIAASRGSQAVFSLVGGAWADHRDRRWSMLLADCVRAVIQLVLGAALVAGVAAVWMLPVGGVVLGAANAFFRGSAIGLTQGLVAGELRGRANALLAISRRASVAVGPLLAALVIAWAGSGAGYVVDGLSFVVSAYCLGRLPAAAPSGPRQGINMLRHIATGGRTVLASRWITCTLIVSAVASIAVGAFYVAGPMVAWQRFGGTGAWAVILTGWGVGGIVGGVVALELRPRDPIRAIWWCTLPVAVQLLVLGYSSMLVPICIAAGVAMASTIVTNTLWMTVLQERLSPQVIGTITSYDFLISLGGMCLGLVAMAPSASRIGLQPTLTVVALVVSACSLAFLAAGRLALGRDRVLERT